MKEILYRLFENGYLDKSEAKSFLTDIAAGKYEEAQVAALITVFLMRSISVDELSGFRDALMEMRIPVDLAEYKAIDIVGTGGDGKNTFNISTASCFVVAGAGYNTVKHGNYGATSVSGASNVMESFGVKFTTDIDKLRHSIEQCKMAYLHAPLFNPALKAVAPVRKHLGVRTFFNLLGPLVNPASPAYQLLGVYNLSLFRLYNYTYQASGIRYGIVNSLDGYDEISLTGDFKFSMPGIEKIYSPEMLGLHRTKEEDLSAGESVEEASRIFLNVLENKATEAQTECVIANAGFAIRVICPEKSIDECLDEARESLKSGRALSIFKRFVELNA